MENRAQHQNKKKKEGGDEQGACATDAPSANLARIERAMDVLDSVVLVASEAQTTKQLRSSSSWSTGLAAAVDRAAAGTERSRAMVRVAGFESKTRLGLVMVRAMSVEKWPVPG